MRVYDDRVPIELRKAIQNELKAAHWIWGWQSQANDEYSFWHAKFGGSDKPDHDGAEQYNCLDEIPDTLKTLWGIILAIAPGQRLVRCYANGYPYGSDGTVHTDSKLANSLTWIYYPHDVWKPDWGGETVFFDNRNEITWSVYPRPGRLLQFAGNVLHAGRGVTRMCKQMRVTLMYKTELM